jgi:hypothetical protein
MKRLTLAGVVLSMTVAGASLAQSSSGSTTTDTPFTITLGNPCTGTVVTLSGIFHAATNFTQTPSGNFNITQHQNWSSVQGSDAFGNSYTSHGTDNGTFNFTAQGGVVITMPGSFQVVGQGSLPNWRMNSLSHITINANGAVTVQFDTFSVACN